MNIPKIAALVPMKGHSERVPHKNIRPLAGKPACHWVLEKLNDCKYIEEIIVDTDDEEIADIVKCFPKVKLLERPDFLKGDMVSIQPLIEYDIQHSSCDFFLQTHSTNPCVEPETYEKAIEAFFSQNEHDALFSVTEIKSRFYWPDGRGINHDPKHLIRTQDLEPIYHDCGQFYMCKSDKFLEKHSLILPKTRPYILPEEEVQDIDTQSDWEIAEAKYSVPQAV